MTNRDIKKILNCPSRVTLNLVLDLVNLKDKELKAITLMSLAHGYVLKIDLDTHFSNMDLCYWIDVPQMTRY